MDVNLKAGGGGLGIPYSAKFSRHIIFAVFADWPQTAKLKLAKCFVVYACIRSIIGPRNVQYDQTAKIKCMRLENLALYSKLETLTNSGMRQRL